jgi:hypothetical protein
MLIVTFGYAAVASNCLGVPGSWWNSAAFPNAGVEILRN